MKVFRPVSQSHWAIQSLLFPTAWLRDTDRNGLHVSCTLLMYHTFILLSRNLETDGLEWPHFWYHSQGEEMPGFGCQSGLRYTVPHSALVAARKYREISFLSSLACPSRSRRGVESRATRSFLESHVLTLRRKLPIARLDTAEYVLRVSNLVARKRAPACFETFEANHVR